MNLILCGMPMSGKSTCGNLAASLLLYDFVDTDRLIEQLYASDAGKKLSAREIYIKEGENSFRRWEQMAIESLSDSKETVIAIGGGCLTNADNVRLLKKIGKLIYLKTSLEELLSRLPKELPAYLDPKDPKHSLKQLMDKRSPVFESSADITLNIEGLPTSEIAGRICSLFSKEISYGEQ